MAALLLVHGLKEQPGSAVRDLEARHRAGVVGVVYIILRGVATTVRVPGPAAPRGTVPGLCAVS